MDISILIFGFLFGFAMQYANLNKFNTISGMSTLEDYTMAKTMGFAIGLGAILIAFEVMLGFASFHVKPLMLTGNIVGGIVFGIGMSILGYCPGTLPISLGQGSLDALVGIVGGLLGGFALSALYPTLEPMLGPNKGAISVYSLLGESNFYFYLVTISIGLLLMLMAFYINLKEKNSSNYKWLFTGIGFALINAVLMLDSVQGRPLGASTAYPYAADVLFGATSHEYFDKIKVPGAWEVIFLAGAFLAGLIPALIRKDFKLKWVHSRWIKYHGPSIKKRLVWAFVGGFILIFGARIAGGCASGHILSGTMQLGAGSTVFAIATFLAFFATGKIFYKNRF